MTVFRSVCSQANAGEIRLEEEIVIEKGPDGRPFQRLTSVAADRTRNEILIVDSDFNRIFVSDRRGEIATILGRREELKNPVGVAVDGKGAVYVSERNIAKIKIFQDEAERMSGNFSEFDLPFEKNRGISPGKMAVGPEGRILVVDEKNGWILVFDSERNFEYRIGSSGRDGKPFKSIVDAVFDARGVLYSAGRGLNPLSEFDKGGEFVRSIEDIRIELEVIQPIGIAVDSRNRLWVLDGVRNSMTIYGPAGNHIQTIEEGEIPGGLFLPVDIEFDGFDNLLVLEQGAGRLRVFSQRY